MQGSTLIHIFKDSIEFLSLGGLIDELTIEDLKLGSSLSRNPNLVSLLHRLGLVEADGSGIPRMMEIYKISETSPEIVIAPNTFLLKLPKLRLRKEYQDIIDYIVDNEFATRENIEKILDSKKVKTVEILNGMIEKNILVKVGNGKNVVYKLKM